MVKFNPFAGKWADCKKRVLFLGDSYLAATPGEDHRFPTLFAQRHPGICAAILATGGWGADQQMIALFAKGLAGQAAPDPNYDLFCGTLVSARGERKNLTVCDDVLFLTEPGGRSFWDPLTTAAI